MDGAMMTVPPAALTPALRASGCGAGSRREGFPLAFCRVGAACWVQRPDLYFTPAQNVLSTGDTCSGFVGLSWKRYLTLVSAREGAISAQS